MTEARVATVDVCLLRRGSAGWETLTLERAAGTRCTGAWEVVHGRMEVGERPEDAAVREVHEETGLEVLRLYNVTVQPFYLQMFGMVTLAVVFAAFVADGPVRLSEEHARGEWLSIDAAVQRLTWPRSRVAVQEAVSLLQTGDAGPVEDVLRIR